MDIRSIAALFDARAVKYVDDDWHRRYANRFVDAIPLRTGSRVLDAGTGTGFAALAAARRVGSEGYVLGVDVSQGMLDQAQRLIDRERVNNVRFVEADASRLVEFDDASFDAVLCSAGLLYMPVDVSLRRWHDLLVPGGLVAFSTMQVGSPATGRIFRQCASAFGLVLEDPSEAIGRPDRCRHALEGAGFRDISVTAGDVPFDAIDPTLAWEANIRSAAHAAVSEFDPVAQNALRDAFLTMLDRAMTEDAAATARADVLFAIGRRA